MLIKYVRNKQKQRIGVVVAIDKNRVGWSKCNFSMGDKFDRKRGKYIAKKRAEKYVFDPNWRCKEFGSTICQDFFDDRHIPQCVHSDFLDMAERANRYFKD